MTENLLLHLQCKKHDMSISRCGCNQYEEAVDPFVYSEAMNLPSFIQESPEADKSDSDGPSV